MSGQLEVLQPGIGTTVQDSGRPGHRHHVASHQHVEVARADDLAASAHLFGEYPRAVR